MLDWGSVALAIALVVVAFCWFALEREPAEAKVKRLNERAFEQDTPGDA